MKKVKLLAPILASVATVAPLTTTLANCSCSNIDYTGITKAIKEDAIKYFQNSISKIYRPTWQGTKMYNKIKEIMSGLGFNEPIHEDHWSDVARKDFKDHSQECPIPDGESYGNIWYDIPATEKCEHWPKIIFSAYYDMDYDTDPDHPEHLEEIKANGIELQVDEENQTMHSKDYKSACGFNDGLGIASMLSLAKHHDKFPHGPIRLLFTCDSMQSTPSYASGADHLRVVQKDASIGEGKKPFDTPFVINSDGNVQAEISVSSAGIHQCQFSKDDYITETIKPTTTYPRYKYTVSVSGLTGGHSATDINDNRANAVKLLSQLITINTTDFNIINFTCNETNSYRIPQSASAEVLISPIKNASGEDITIATAEERKKSLTEAFENAFPTEKGKINIGLQHEYVTSGEYVCLPKTMSNMVCVFINLVKYGSLVWFDEEHKQVKTSENICPFNVSKNADGKYSISGAVTCRSANSTQLEVFAADTHNYLSNILGISSSETELLDVETPVWENSEEVYAEKNRMSHLLQDAYKRFRYTPKEVNVHGWLEAACFPACIEQLSKPGSHVVPYIATIGPQIVNTQTRNEKVYTSTLNSCLRVLVYSLVNAQTLEKKI